MLESGWNIEGELTC
jgi:F0F1-type ATP synthase epsilon subunit